MKQTKQVCPTCGHNTTPYIFTFDVADALLLYAIAKEVRARKEVIKDFTIANQVHVPNLKGISHATKCRTTHCSKLGLLAKLMKNGKHVAGCWVVTSRGWQALRGEPVPAEVVVTSGEITQRGAKTATIYEALQNGKANIEKAIARNKKPVHDYRADVDAYRPSDWVTYGVAQTLTEATGQLF